MSIDNNNTPPPNEDNKPINTGTRQGIYIVPAKIRHYTRQIRQTGQFDQDMLSETDLEEIENIQTNQNLPFGIDTVLAQHQVQSVQNFVEDAPQLSPFIFPEEPDVEQLPSIKSLFSDIFKDIGQ